LSISSSLGGKLDCILLSSQKRKKWIRTKAKQENAFGYTLVLR
jgi:hypothetical protein